MHKIHTVILLTALLTTGRMYADDSDRFLATPIPGAWVKDNSIEQTLPDDDSWWQRFDDPVLNTLVDKATENNFNLLEAYHRREMARNMMLQARSAYWPQVTATASYMRDRTGGINTNTYSLGAGVNWEIDIFGKVREAVKAKKASYRASRAEYVGAMQSTAAEMATYYIDYRLLQSHLAIAREHLESQARVLEIAEARHEAGLVSKLDVAQARTVYLSTEASIPSLKSSMRQSLTAIATLMGVYPDSISSLLESADQLPDHRMLIPAGIPADLLRRRPDIMAAEAAVEEAAANIGIAKKEYLPSLSLTGEIGTMAYHTDDLFTRKGFHYSVSPTLSWTIFDGLSRKYDVAQAREQMEGSINAYNLTVMTAVGEVDNAISAYNAALETLEVNTRLLDQSHEALSLSIDQYKQGLSAFTNVVDAQIDLLNAANSMVTAKGNAIIAIIDLYKALGGSPIIQ